MWKHEFMNVFAIIRVGDPSKMKAALEENFPNDTHDVGNDTWLVAFNGTAGELSEKIGVTSQSGQSSVGAAIIVQFEDYFGRAPRPTWDWIKNKLEEPNG